MDQLYAVADLHLENSEPSVTEAPLPIVETHAVPVEEPVGQPPEDFTDIP